MKLRSFQVSFRNFSSFKNHVHVHLSGWLGESDLSGWLGESHFLDKENEASCILCLFEMSKTSATQ